MASTEDPARTEAAFRIELLGRRHDRAAFSCNVPALDQYLHSQARQDAAKRLAAVFILTPDGRTVAGYYTLSQYSVELDQIPEEIGRQLTRYPEVPATLIGRLAVSSAFRGRDLGAFLLMDALRRALGGSREIASYAVVVDAKDDAVTTFYRKYGFIPFPGLPRKLFLPMATIEWLFPD